MKRFILTSLCTLGLSLLGAYGANQSFANAGSKVNAELYTNNVEQNIEDKDTQDNVSIDGSNISKDSEAENTKNNLSKTTPQQLVINNVKTNTEVTDNTLTTEKAEESDGSIKVKKLAVTKKKTTKKKTAKKKNTKKTNAAKKKSTKTNAVKQVVNTKNATKATNTTIENAIKNGNVYIYKNVNLSNCDTLNEVVKKLQDCGYTNINSSNIQNIEGLKDILAGIQKGQASSKPTAEPTKAPAKPTVAPTKAPAKPTAAPTKAPAKPTPTTKPAPTTKPSEPSDNTGISSYANQVLQLVNQERAKAGLSSFTTNSTLTAAANKRAQETVQSFSHTRPNGSSFSTVLQEFGVSYQTAGENIAYGQRTPQEVVTGWMNSPGHRANILNANFNKIGIGVYQKNGTIYWSQLFTN